MERAAAFTTHFGE